MKKTILTAVTALGIVLGTAPTMAAESISSLRGDHDLNADAIEATKKKPVSQKGGFGRSYKQQPPMVPHSVEKDVINLKTNSCLKCHSKATAEREKAPVAGESHFIDRDGKVEEKISSRRYFCNQCHAPQVDASPLVKNEFAGAK